MKNGNGRREMKRFLVMHVCFLAFVLSISALADLTWAEDVKGRIKIDGSSTVYPITEAVAEEFQREYPKVRTTVGISGTGGGVNWFFNGHSNKLQADVTSITKKKGSGRDDTDDLEFRTQYQLAF
ncbi:MAG: substrate-binding domain-containing protein [Planctomycetota bacterium]|jgi:ABC-type phosphate transport system substrate-binding protein